MLKNIRMTPKPNQRMQPLLAVDSKAQDGRPQRLIRVVRGKNMADQGKGAAILFAGLLFGAGVIAIAAPTNQAQQDWDPADPRNGTTVTGVVEVAHAGNARCRYKAIPSMNSG